MTKEKIIEILEGAKDWNGDVPFEIAVKAISKMAENIPQQPEIIHCRECHYRIRSNVDGKMICNLGILPGTVKDDDFCSRAERRTDETL